MGSSAEQANAQVAATRQRLEASLDRLEGRLRRDLDPKYRLRRDGARLAAGAVVVVAVGAALWVRGRRRRGEAAPTDWIEAMPEEWRMRLQQLLAEAAERGGLEAKGQGHGRQGRRPLWQTVGLRAGRMAAPVVMNSVANRLAGRRGEGGTS